MSYTLRLIYYWFWRDLSGRAFGFIFFSSLKKGYRLNPSRGRCNKKSPALSEAFDMRQRILFLY